MDKEPREKITENSDIDAKQREIIENSIEITAAINSCIINQATNALSVALSARLFLYKSCAALEFSEKTMEEFVKEDLGLFRSMKALYEEFSKEENEPLS